MNYLGLQPDFLWRAERFFDTNFDSVSFLVTPEPLRLGALAFACGDEIHISPGATCLPPAPLAGLLIHEMAHVVQQRAGRVSAAAPQPVCHPWLEAEAEDSASWFTAGVPHAPAVLRSVPARGVRGAAIQLIKRDKYLYFPDNSAAPSDPGLLIKFQEFQQKVIKAFNIDKGARTQRASQSHKTMVEDLKPNGNRSQNAQVLLDYEKAHLEGGGDWASLKSTLLSLRLAPAEGVSTEEEILQVDDSQYVSASGTGSATVKCKLRKKYLEDVGKKKKKISYDYFTYNLGTVLFGDTRFTLLAPQPANVVNQVYVRGRVMGLPPRIVTAGSPRHYVLLTNSNTYAKRFVVRGINHEDAAALGGNQKLMAPVTGDQAGDFEISDPKPLPPALEGKNLSGRHPKATGDNLTSKEQIVSHTRGWQKRFISTGVSKREAYSTRGVKFDGLYGAVLIDLAKVDVTKIFDLHTPAAVSTVLGLDAMKVSTATDPGLDVKSTDDEEFLALRDVLRTRELLIKKEVPALAVLKSDLGKRIVGVGSYSKIDEKALVSRLETLDAWKYSPQTDLIEYKGLSNRYWFFMRFTTTTQADEMWHQANGARQHGETVITLSAYTLPDTVDGR